VPELESTLNNGLGFSSLIILVTFDAVANLTHSFGMALLHILVYSVKDFVKP